MAPPSDFARQKATSEANIILIACPGGRGLGSRFRLVPGAAVEIGRAPEADISFPDVPSISRRHARVVHGGERVTIEDLGSKNRTYVNDVLIEGPTVLESGDRFQVGALVFKFLHELDIEHSYHEEIYNLGVLDALTGAFNRRKFEEDIQRELEHAQRLDRELTLVMLDLDDFKRVNDVYGHLAGDQVLRAVVRTVRGALEPAMMLARLGGDEFAILLPECGLERGMALAERLRSLLSHLIVPYSGVNLKTSASIGVASVTRTIKKAEDLVALADRSLYRSKGARKQGGGGAK